MPSPLPALTAAVLFSCVLSTGSSAAAPGYVLPDGSNQVVCFSDLQGITQRLTQLYTQAHPETRFTLRPANDLAALQCLVYDSSAFAPVATDALGGAAVAYGAIIKAEPFLVRIAHASLSPGARISPIAVIANRSNPIESISADQVARAFTETMRKATLTHWGQLGVDGALANEDIHPYSLPWSDHLPSEEPEFPDFVFMRKLGGGPPVASLTMAETHAQVVARVAADPQGLGLVALNRVTPEVKVLGLVANAWAVPSTGSREDVVAGRYAFDRYIYVFVRRVPGQPFDPLVKEYLRIALSPAGQDAIAKDPTGYLPLNAVEVGEECAKLQ